MSENPSKEPYVIGQQFANALKQEQARSKAAISLPSPLPQGKYKTQPGELELLNPTFSEVDSQIRHSCQIFSGLSQPERAKFTSAISMDDFYKLIEFARRASVFSLQAKDKELLRDGLVALSIIEVERTDFRDILWALALLHHSASRIGLDADFLIRDTAQLGEPNLVKLMVGFVDKDARFKNLKDSWGYLEVQTEFGLGFVRWGFKPYSPKKDLLSTAIKIASIIDADSYRTSGIELATNFPDVWLKIPDSTLLKEMLAKLLGCVTINARLLPDKHPKANSQQFTVFLMETDSSNSASSLLDLSRTKQPKNYSMLGFAASQTFCLVITRSFVQGDAAFESNESLARFHKSIQRAID